MKAFLARVVYQSEEHGVLDAEFAVDDHDELRELIERGPGLKALISMSMERPPHMPANETIESLVRKLAEREDEGC